MSQNLKTWKKSNICKCSLLKASALKLCKENPSVHQLSIFNASLTSFCSFQCSLTTKRNPLLLRKLGSSFEKTLASSVYTLKFSAVLAYFFFVQWQKPDMFTFHHHPQGGKKEFWRAQAHWQVLTAPPQLCRKRRVDFRACCCLREEFGPRSGRFTSGL